MRVLVGFSLMRNKANFQGLDALLRRAPFDVARAIGP